MLLSFYLSLVVESRCKLYQRGLAEALRRADLKPLSQWAAAHLPPKTEYASPVSVEDSSIPEEVWRTIPFKGRRPFLKFFPTAEEDTWILMVDHSGAFVSHNGFILTLGKDIDPKTTGWFIHRRPVAPHVWIY